MTEGERQGGTGDHRVLLRGADIAASNMPARCLRLHAFWSVTRDWSLVPDRATASALGTRITAKRRSRNARTLLSTVQQIGFRRGAARSLTAGEKIIAENGNAPPRPECAGDKGKFRLTLLWRETDSNSRSRVGVNTYAEPLRH